MKFDISTIATLGDCSLDMCISVFSTFAPAVLHATLPVLFYTHWWCVSQQASEI